MENTISDRIVISRVDSIIDGDSFTVSVHGWPKIIGHKICVRVSRIDCPEVRGKTARERSLAQAARQFLATKLASARVVSIHHLQRDKYFRILADVEIDGFDLGVMMIQAGLARRYSGGRRLPW
jgi:endonuclease YncB( thermonuclease family)